MDMEFTPTMVSTADVTKPKFLRETHFVWKEAVGASRPWLASLVALSPRFL